MSSAGCTRAQAQLRPWLRRFRFVIQLQRAVQHVDQIGIAVELLGLDREAGAGEVLRDAGDAAKPVGAFRRLGPGRQLVG